MYENWLQENGQSVLPYIIACEQLNNLLNIYLIFNGEKYVFNNLTKAVEVAYKCYLALNISPYLCDYVWSFIDKYFYKLDIKIKSFVPVNKLIS